MFRAFYTPIIRSKISTVSTASGTNHKIVSATFFQRGLVLILVSTRPRWKKVPEAVDTVEIVLLMMGVVCKTPETCRVTWQWNKIDCKQLHQAGYLKE
jgi:hypothetical protein